MTSTRSMAPFYHLAVAGDPVTWQGVVIGVFGTGGITALFTFIFTRYGKRVDDAATARQKAVSDDATVQTAKIGSQDKLEEAYRREIHRLMNEANERIQKLEVRVATTEDKLETMRAKYVHLYVYAERLQDRNQALLREIKRAQPDFHDEDFRRIDLSPLAPDSLFAAAGVTQVSITIPPDPKKATARITLPPEAAPR